MHQHLPRVFAIKRREGKMRNSRQKSGWYPMKDVMFLQILS